MNDPFLKDRILAETDIVELVSPHVKLRKAGNILKGLCPFHNEKSPSFTVNPDRGRFHCFGCGEGGDVFDWVKKYQGANTFPEQLKILAERLGIHVDGLVADSDFRPVPKQKRRRTAPRSLPCVPTLDPGSDEERAALAFLRGFRRETVDRAVEMGFLGFCTRDGLREWVVTDRTRVNAQTRRLDGEKYWDGVKSLTITGSWGSWPIGIGDVGDCPTILLAEGGPDFLAALEICPHIPAVPVGVFGTPRFHQNSLALFNGKRVVHAQHNDDAGCGAVERWAEQLEGRATLKAVRMTGKKGADLNDLLMELSAGECAEIFKP